MDDKERKLAELKNYRDRGALTLGEYVIGCLKVSVPDWKDRPEVVEHIAKIRATLSTLG